ncbi:hypothetical protein BAnh1_04120 [Bartonella australis AUST/NH1]|uniref:PF07598 family protein n=1 Tax=Bartonella australis (strain Aust/NH1) TaxID=1094489 RepID=M1NSH2_BARAA|nr:DUF1561 family protein [Bartonella australis]AGF74293.1 hypothetical protein BAnh1_04120 [Bartonella australis AUST/NH1]
MRYDRAPFFNSGNCDLNKKNNLSFFSFFFVFLFSFNPLFAAPIPPTPEVSQKRTDKPIDKAIRVKVHNGGEYCYAPAFVDGESYIYINDCSSSSVQFARYDVFQRVAWKVRNVWLCMTAPNSVTGVGRRATADWDYIKLRPCVINDANQRWIIKNNAFYTADGKFRVKDYKWYAYISKNKEDYYNHTLSSEMKRWTETIATPGNMSLKTSLSWKFTGTSGFNMYYISNDGSKPEVFDLYYNPENGHIARYFPSAGILSCMASQQSSSEDWNWVVWSFCSDNISGIKDNGYWRIPLLVGREGPLLDYQGNFLRITQYGSNWGRPYTAKPSYLKQDTENSPKSEFVLSYDIERWNRYVMANVEDALPYCPAPGKKQNIPASKQRVKRTLPSDFQLNEEWLQRLYDIAATTPGFISRAGACGVCFIQTFQMIAEIRDRFPDRPRERGYFFDTALNTDPMVSLRRRYPRLFGALELADTLYGVSISPTEDITVTRVRSAAAAAQIALPNFEWERSSIATEPDDILAAIRGLLAAPVGTIWIGLSTHIMPDGSESGHAFPILRSSGGVIIIPTNIQAPSATLSAFSRLAAETNSIRGLLIRIAQSRQGFPASFATLRLTEVTAPPLSTVISQNDCTGEGDSRRGSRELPRSSFINQCTNGRCTLL